MSRPTEVLVSVEDLELVTRGQPTVIDTASPEPWASAWNRLVAAIPPTEWEPSEEQIKVWLTLFYKGTGGYESGEWRDDAMDELKSLHDAGFTMP